MLRYSVKGSIAWLSLNRPEANDASTQAFYDERVESLTQADANADVRSIILHGACQSFCAGGDVKDFSSMAGTIGGRITDMAAAMAGFSAVQRCEKPVIAAVHGFVLGGGCELTMDEHAKTAVTLLQGTEDFKEGSPPSPSGDPRPS
jgi:enoyl-CoA hydratase/carnithine racemase